MNADYDNNEDRPSWSEIDKKKDSSKHITGSDQGAKPKSPKKIVLTKKQIALFLSLAGFTVLIIILAFVLQKDITVEVIEKSWERTIELEEYMLVEESDWTVPSGGTLISQSEEIHHYNQIQVGTETVYEDVEVAVGEREYVCGQEDLGNGYFEDIYCSETIYETRTESHEEPIYEDEPVYATYYTYTIWRWTEIEPLHSAGKNSEAVWPIVSDDENIRSTDSVAKYEMIVEDEKNREHIEKLKFDKWKIYKLNDEIIAKASLLFGFYIGLEK